MFGTVRFIHIQDDIELMLKNKAWYWYDQCNNIWVLFHELAQSEVNKDFYSGLIKPITSKSF